MKTLRTFSQHLVFALFIAVAPAAALMPAYASAATKASASISASSLSTDSSSYAYVSGTASGAARVRLSLTSTTSMRTLYKTGTIYVSKGEWHASVGKHLPAGQYTVRIYNAATGALLTRGTLTVRGTDAAAAAPVVTTVTTTTTSPTNATTPSISISTANTSTSSTMTTTITDPNTVVVSGPTTLKVSVVPLLSGGNTTPGATVPIEYLQVVNQGDATSTINGFWLTEDGNASVNSIIGFSTVDDKGNNRNSVGGIEGQSVFTNGKGFAPSGAAIGPHQMKLFTIKAQLSKTAVRGTNMQLNIAGVDAPQAIFNSSFPLMGVTWTIGG